MTAGDAIVAQNSDMMVNENPVLDECLEKLKTFMNSLENHSMQKLLLRLRKLLTVDYHSKREVLRFYLKQLFAIMWDKSTRSDKQIIVQAVENYLVNRNCSVSANALLYCIESTFSHFLSN